MSDISSLDALESKIRSLSGKPKVLEALWAGDNGYWELLLYVYHSSGFLKLSTERMYIGDLVRPKDIREEFTLSALARLWGDQMAKKYGIEFYFPAEDQPDDDCPAWNMRHLARKCADCGKLIIVDHNSKLPKDICYPCYLERERKAELKANKMCYESAIAYSVPPNGVHNQIYLTTNYKSLEEYSPFVFGKVTSQLKEKGITIVILNHDDLLNFEIETVTQLEKYIEEYELPKEDRFKPRIALIEYKDKKYELDITFGGDHREMYSLSNTLKTIRDTLFQDAIYKIYVRKDFTHRDDSILRFLKYKFKELASIEQLAQEYKGTLSTDEVVDSLKKLKAMECVVMEWDHVKITDIGKYSL